MCAWRDGGPGGRQSKWIEKKGEAADVEGFFYRATSENKYKQCFYKKNKLTSLNPLLFTTHSSACAATPARRHPAPPH